jgi:hypothetical protein
LDRKNDVNTDNAGAACPKLDTGGLMSKKSMSFPLLYS